MHSVDKSASIILPVPKARLFPDKNTFLTKPDSDLSNPHSVAKDIAKISLLTVSTATPIG
jgi:hypothetical protein